MAEQRATDCVSGRSKQEVGPGEGKRGQDEAFESAISPLRVHVEMM
jgi:hypothetical protein